MYTRTLSDSSHLHPEDGVSKYLRNVGNTTTINSALEDKSRINIDPPFYLISLSFTFFHFFDTGFP